MYPHDLGIGGSQLTAIEIAGRVNRLGHESVVFGCPGALCERIGELGLEFLPSPSPGKRPSPRVCSALGRIVVDRGIDLVHGYEWPPALEAFLVAQRSGVASIATIMSMSVAPFLPRSMPLLVGTEQIAAAETLGGRRKVATLEPPVDLDLNNPSVEVGAADFRAKWGLSESDLNVVVVTRLAHEMKLEGILVAIETLGELARRIPLNLLIVGGGPAEPEVVRRATSINDRVGRSAIVLTGEIADPRPAYAIADIILGMGGSALRALAFAKPLIVQGEQGFWRVLDEDSVPEFLWSGWYGIGDGAETGAARLSQEIAPLLLDRSRRKQLGDYGRRLVERRFSLDHAAEIQIAAYEEALSSVTRGIRAYPDFARSIALYSDYAVRRKLSKRTGRAPRDDFNSKPVAIAGPHRPQ